MHQSYERIMSSCLPHVILIHGLGRHSTSMRQLATTLRRQNYQITNWGYSSRAHTLDVLADQLTEVYTQIAQTATIIHVVTHSMGGIVLRRLLARTELPQLGKIAMLAPPNNGSQVAYHLLANPLLKSLLGPAAYALTDCATLNALCAVPSTPILVIAGTNARDVRNPVSLLSRSLLQEPNDGTVTVRETMLPRMDMFIQVLACHTLIMNHPDTVTAVREFLRA